MESRHVTIEDHHRLTTAFADDAHRVFVEVSQRCGCSGQCFSGRGSGPFIEERFTPYLPHVLCHRASIAGCLGA